MSKTIAQKGESPLLPLLNFYAGAVSDSPQLSYINWFDYSEPSS